jgi:dCTP diphosphatase
MNVDHLVERLRAFAAERDWDQFHTPKNLAIAISTEAAELLELFQWSRGTGEWTELTDPKLRERVEDELADVLLYLLRFGDLAGVDLEAAANRKLDLNALKYPVDQFRGSDRKYNEMEPT